MYTTVVGTSTFSYKRTFALSTTKDLGGRKCCLTTAGGSGHLSDTIGHGAMSWSKNSGTSLTAHDLPSNVIVTCSTKNARVINGFKNDSKSPAGYQ